MIQLSEACPRFDRCAVNNCPLHSDYGGRLEAHPADPEQRCRLSKLKRLRVVARYPELAAKLPLGGLTPREYAGAKNEAALTPEQWKARARKLAALANFRRLPGLPSGKGTGAGPRGTGAEVAETAGPA